MPCIFCLAVLALLAGAVTASWLDVSEERLGERATGPVTRTRETESVCVWDLQAAVDGTTTAVTVTVYKDEKRVRIQIHSHDLDDDQLRRLEDELAALLEAEITERAGQEGIHALEDEDEEAEAMEAEAEAAAEATAAERERLQDKRRS